MFSRDDRRVGYAHVRARIADAVGEVDRARGCYRQVVRTVETQSVDAIEHRLEATIVVELDDLASSACAAVEIALSIVVQSVRAFGVLGKHIDQTGFDIEPHDSVVCDVAVEHVRAGPAVALCDRPDHWGSVFKCPRHGYVSSCVFSAID